MNIAQIKTYIVSEKLGEKSFCYSQNWYNSRTIMLLEIITDDGLSGWGEAFGNAFINQTIVEKVYTDKIIGQNIFDTEKIWDELYNTLRDNGQKGSCIQALSAVDNALWDLKGKYTHLPVYRLLGGARRSEIIPYATGLYHTALHQSAQELVAEAVSYVHDGFSAVKMKIGFGVEFGTYFTSSPDVELTATNLLSPTSNQKENLKEALDTFKFIPRIQIRLAYKF